MIFPRRVALFRDTRLSAKTDIQCFLNYFEAGFSELPGVNYLGLSTSIILAGGSEA